MTIIICYKCLLCTMLNNFLVQFLSTMFKIISDTIVNKLKTNTILNPCMFLFCQYHMLSYTLTLKYAATGNYRYDIDVKFASPAIKLIPCMSSLLVLIFLYNKNKGKNALVHCLYWLDYYLIRERKLSFNQLIMYIANVVVIKLCSWFCYYQTLTCTTDTFPKYYKSSKLIRITHFWICNNKAGEWFI